MGENEIKNMNKMGKLKGENRKGDGKKYRPNFGCKITLI
jgi:hypothetical protein